MFKVKFLVLFLPTAGALFILYPLFFPPAVHAHLFGPPTFFKVNDIYSNFYSVPLTSLSNFPLPQDQSPANYLVNAPIHFNFDVSRLPAPPDVVAKTQFSWDFNDGTPKGNGLSLDHIYTKMGSFVLTIFAYDGTTPTPQVIESVMLNILPNKDYQLPKSIIKVNGVESKSITDTLHFKFGQNLHLDGSASTDPESKITSYFWDLGDETSSDLENLDHFYPSNGASQIFPVLRIRDANGFIADSIVEIEQATANAQVSKTPGDSTTPTSMPPFILIGSVVLVLGFLYALSKKRLKRQNSLFKH